MLGVVKNIGRICCVSIEQLYELEIWYTARPTPLRGGNDDNSLVYLYTRIIFVCSELPRDGKIRHRASIHSVLKACFWPAMFARALVSSANIAWLM